MAKHYKAMMHMASHLIPELPSMTTKQQASGVAKKNNNVLIKIPRDSL